MNTTPEWQEDGLFWAVYESYNAGRRDGIRWAEAFWADANAKACAARDRACADAARWRAILAEVVGEENAEMMFRDPDRAPESPREVS